MVFIILPLWMIWPIAGAYFGYERGRPIEGMCLGLLLGPFGLIWLGTMLSDRREEQRAAQQLKAHIRARVTGDARIYTVRDEAGRPLGTMRRERIQQLIVAGQLTTEAEWHDPQSGTWYPMDLLPA